MISNDLKVDMWLIETPIDYFKDVSIDVSMVVYQVLDLNKKENKIKLDTYKFLGSKNGTSLIQSKSFFSYSNFYSIEPMNEKNKREFIKKLFDVEIFTKI